MTFHVGADPQGPEEVKLGGMWAASSPGSGNICRVELDFFHLEVMLALLCVSLINILSLH